MCSRVCFTAYTSLPSRTIRTMCREMPRGSGTTTSSPHSSSERCQGSVTKAGFGFVATMRSAMPSG